MAQQQPDPATAAAANRDISAEEHMFSLFSKELGVSEAGSADAKPTPATEQPDTPAASGDVPADESPATEEAEATADGDEATPTPAEEAPAADPASADEHAKAGLRLEDYTRKTMEHAENVRKFEAERAQFEATQRQTLERYQERLAAADALLKAQTPAEPDWPKLRADLSETEFAGAVADWQIAQSKMQKVEAERQRVEAELRQSRAAEQTKVIRTEQERLLVAIPEWKDAAKAKTEGEALWQYAKTAGFTDDDLQGVSDHRAVLMLRKAMLYDQLLAQKPRVSVPAKVPPTAKPGAQRAAPRNDPLQAAQQRLAKTGKVDDAAEAFFHLINEKG